MYLVQKVVCLVDSGNDVKLNIIVLQVWDFEVAAQCQVAQSKIVNCFHQCSNEYELNTEADMDSRTEEEDACHED
jgi:hypothetical protein